MEHAVVLVAPNGREQAARLKASAEGLVLSTPEQMELNTFPLRVIRKWLPSDKRTRSPGAPDSLDVQIQTDEGPRDLRMRCTSAAAVQTIMSDLQAAFQTAGLLLPTGMTSMGSTPSVDAMASATAGSEIQATHASTMQSTAAQAAAPAEPQAAADITSLTLNAAPEASADSGSKLLPLWSLSSPSLSPVDISATPDAAVQLPPADSTASEPSPTVAASQVTDRSVEQLGSGLEQGDTHLVQESQAVQEQLVQQRAAREAELKANQETQALKGQLVQEQLVQQHAALETELRSTQAELSGAKTQLESLSAELARSEALRAEEGVAMVVRMVAQLAVDRVLAGQTASMVQEDLEDTQVELSVTKAQLQAAEQRGEEAQQVKAALAESEESLVRLQQLLQEKGEAVVAAEQQANELRQQLGEAQALLDGERAAAEKAAAEAAAAHDAITQEAAKWRRELEEMRHQYAVQQAEVSAGQARILSALEGQAVLQVELGSVREQLESEQAQVAAERAEVARQRSTIASLESQLAELLATKVELEGSLARAGEEAEAARTTIAGMTLGQKELQRETAALRERLEAVRQVSRDQVLGEVQLRVEEAGEQLRLAQEECEAAKKQAEHQLATSQRLQREVTSLTQELAVLRSELEESRSNQCGMSVMSLNVMERLQALEKTHMEVGRQLEAAREELKGADVRVQAAEQKAGEADRRNAATAALWAAERSKLEAQWEVERQGWQARVEVERQGGLGGQPRPQVERQSTSAEALWQVERQALEAKVRQLARALGQVEEHAISKYDGMLGLVEQVESLESELHVAQSACARLEEELRVQSSMQRRELAAVQAKLDAATEGSGRRLVDAEAQVEAKEKLLARWREEAQGIAVKLEGALAEHRRELEEQRQEAATLAQQCKVLKRENVTLRSQLGDVQAAASYLRSLVGEGDVRLEQLGGRLSEAQGREKELEHEVQALHALLDRARVAFAAKRVTGGSYGSPMQAAGNSLFTHGLGEGSPRDAYGDGVQARGGKVTPRSGAAKKTAAVMVMAAD